MVELIIVACLTAAPSECSEHRLEIGLRGMEAAQCVYASPPLVARWGTMNPKYEIKSWKCELIGRPREA